jgi:hypothetical protein
VCNVCNTTYQPRPARSVTSALKTPRTFIHQAVGVLVATANKHARTACRSSTRLPPSSPPGAQYPVSEPVPDNTLNCIPGLSCTTSKEKRPLGMKCSPHHYTSHTPIHYAPCQQSIYTHRLVSQHTSSHQPAHTPAISHNSPNPHYCQPRPHNPTQMQTCYSTLQCMARRSANKQPTDTATAARQP